MNRKHPHRACRTLTGSAGCRGLRRSLAIVAVTLAAASPPASADLVSLVADVGQRVPLPWDVPSIGAAVPRPVELGGSLYFFHDDGVHGRELWRSDGTAVGTAMVKDLCPGSCGSESWQS